MKDTDVKYTSCRGSSELTCVPSSLVSAPTPLFEMRKLLSSYFSPLIINTMSNAQLHKDTQVVLLQHENRCRSFPFNVQRMQVCTRNEREMVNGDQNQPRVSIGGPSGARPRASTGPRMGRIAPSAVPRLEWCQPSLQAAPSTWRSTWYSGGPRSGWCPG